MSNEEDIKYLTSIFNDENNGLTLCTGSLGVNKKNNIIRIIKKYGNFINFIHLKNIIIDKKSKNFFETSHLYGDIDKELILELNYNHGLLLSL